MAVVRCPPLVSSLTLVTSGVLAPDGNNQITCTAAEATIMVQQTNQIQIRFTTISTGLVRLLSPALNKAISSISGATSGAHVVAGNGQIGTDFTALEANSIMQNGFQLVTG